MKAAAWRGRVPRQKAATHAELRRAQRGPRRRFTCRPGVTRVFWFKRSHL